MKNYIYLFSVLIIGCSTNSDKGRFEFLTLQNEIIKVKDFELYLSDQNENVFFYIKDDILRKKVSTVSLRTVKYIIDKDTLEGKLIPVYSRIIEDYYPFHFEIKKNIRCLTLPRNYDGKVVYYIGNTQEIAPQIINIISK